MASSIGCGLALAAGVVVVPALLASATIVAMNPFAATDDAPEEVEGIDPTLLEAYVRGPAVLDTDEYAQCTGMRWAVLAGIGSGEADHGATVTVNADGTTDPPFTGPRLDGSGVGGNTTPHYDTDGGQWDGDDEYDRAVGLTQHLPANWADYGIDATGSGEADPHNVFDSVASTAVELCQSAQGAEVDFSDRDDLEDALFRYNPADWYVDDVMAEIEGYDALSLAGSAGEGSSGAGQQAVEWALDQIGVPYVWGGNGSQDGGFDCSGLTQQAWSAAGVDIPRVTTDQFSHGDRVDTTDELQPGDLLFYNRGPDPQPGHVTMYVGDGEMINAPSSGEVVRLDPIDMEYYATAFVGAVRPD